MISYVEFLGELSGISNLNMQAFKLNRVEFEAPCLFTFWTSGGMLGRSIDGGPETNEAVQPEPESELDGLDQILERFSPSITMLKYKKLLREIILKGEVEGNGDWHGAYSNYGYKHVELRKLYDYMVRESLFEV